MTDKTTADSSSPHLLLLYGTQTGTAEELAERAARTLRRRHLQVRVLAMDAYDRSRILEDTHVLFLCATTGDGDEPDSMKRFWRFLLRKDLPVDLLSHWRYAVFGLGDSSYAKFNYAAKRLHKRLQQLGAQPLVQRVPACALGDEQHALGLDGVFVPWLAEVVACAQRAFPEVMEREPLGDDILLPPAFRLVECDAEAIAANTSDTKIVLSTNGLAPSAHATHTSTVAINKRITEPSHFQAIHHLELEATSEIAYAPGDVLSLFPQNTPSDVDRLLALVPAWHACANKRFYIQPTSPDKRLPPHIHPECAYTLRELLLAHVEPFSVPRSPTYFLELLSHFLSVQDPDRERKQERLREMLGLGGQYDVFEYVQRARRTAFEILYDFAGKSGGKGVAGKNATQSTSGAAVADVTPAGYDIPLDYVVDLFGWMRAREFSISSAPSMDRRRIALTVGIVNYRSPLIRAPRVGICTQWMKEWRIGDKVAFSIKAGTMRLPASRTTPCIFIGPGLGIAPMRSMVRERMNAAATSDIDNARSADSSDYARSPDNIADVLFYGCRYRAKDYLYAEEWEQWTSNGQLQFHVVFSRDDPVVSPHANTATDIVLSSTTETVSSTSMVLRQQQQSPSHLQQEQTQSQQQSQPQRYVQHAIAAQAPQLWSLIHNHHAHIYLSGNAQRMPDDVIAALKHHVLVGEGGMTVAEADAYFQRELFRTRRFQQETWS